MSDPVKPESAPSTDAAAVEPVEPVAAEPTAVEPATVEPATVEPTAPAAAAPAAVAPAEAPRKKRGVGAWSFVVGLLTGLVDLAFVVWVVVVLVGAIGDLTAGNLAGISTAIGAAGLVLVALFVFFGGFLTAGLAALLGLIALISGRGRVLGVFGLIFGLGALAVRIALLSAGFSPDLG